VLNVDIWNIWHMAFTGIIVQLATGSFWLGVLGVVVHAALSYKLGDMYGAVTDDYFGLEGVAIPHGTSAIMGVFAAPIDGLIEKIPGLRRVTINTETLEEKVGFFGQPIVIGTVLGLVVGLLAGYPIGDSLQLAVEMGAVMLLMPMVVKLIMQGLMPIADAARDMLQKRFKNADYKIGLDPALLLGQPQVISASLIFVPLSIVIAIAMPGNRVLPFGDLATIGFFVAIAVGIHKGNIFRTLFSGTLIMSVTIWIANQMVPLTTELAQVTDKLGDASQVASLDQGGNPVTYLLARGLSGQVGIGFLVIAVLYIFCWVYTFVKYRRGTLYRADEPELEAEAV
jgi:PTS system galactitol-specific IIC component